jgi:glycosyltransferase family protein
MKKIIKTILRNISPAYRKLEDIENKIEKSNLQIEELKSIIINMAYEKKDVIYPNVVSANDTIDILLKTNLSLCRYGNGEFLLITERNTTGELQEVNESLILRLKEILKSKNDKILVGIPDVFSNLFQSTYSKLGWWSVFLMKYRRDIYNILDLNKTYYDSFLTRPYVASCYNYEYTKNIFEKIKKLWNNKNVVIIEGEKTRLGVNNNLLKNAKSIKRILCPARNAYSKYEQILQESLKLSKDNLILIALGSTATVLAYDLSLQDYQAIDIGHLDIEYEWFLENKKSTFAVKYKFTNEAKGGHDVENIENIEYNNQILCKILD